MANILIADDDKEYISAFTAAMISQGHHVDAVETGDQVLPRLAQNRADIVFLDVLMPGGGAITLIHAVRASHPDLPIVVLTGNVSVLGSPIMKTGMRSANARIAKTATLREIADLVNGLL